MAEKKRPSSYTEKQKERIRLGHAIVNDFFGRQQHCACCGLPFPCAGMVKLTVSLKGAFGRRPEQLPPACFIGLPEVSSYYRSLQFSSIFQGTDLFGHTISAQEWLIRHSESAISRRQSEFVYATLYCPLEPWLKGIRLPPPGETAESRKAERKARRSYEAYLTECEAYVQKGLPGRKGQEFVCFECAAACRQKAAELTAAFQKAVPPESRLPEECLDRDRLPRHSAAGKAAAGKNKAVPLPLQKQNRPVKQAERITAGKQPPAQSWEGLLANELGWLPGEYICLRRFPRQLRLSSKEFNQGEEQEYSQLIVSPYGVFSISSENLDGTLTITPEGRWMHRHGKTSESILPPVLMARRRAQLLESILPEGTPVYTIICVASRSVAIEGAEYAEYPVIRCDLLRPLIEGIARKAGARYSSRQVNSQVLQLSKYIRK